MICLETVKKFCKEYRLIENYDQAMADTTQTWHCHHRHEIDWALSKEELIAIGRYYDVHYSELIFLTPEEHKRLHFRGENNPQYGKEGTRKGKEGYWRGKEGDATPNYKYHITEDELYDLYVVKGLTLQKIADLYGCCITCIWLKLKKYAIRKKPHKEASKVKQ